MTLFQLVTSLFLLPFYFAWADPERLPRFEKVKTLTQPSWDPEPFWKKPGVQKAMHSEDRKLAVSVSTNSQHHLVLKGAGIIHKPPAVTYKAVTNFGKAKNWSKYLKDTGFNADREQLAVHAEVMKFSATSLVQLSRTRCEDHPCLLWEILTGTFKGLRGGIEFRPDVDAQNTEISMRAEYAAEKVPLLAGLTAVGLEGVMQRMAASVREYIEKTPEREL